MADQAINALSTKTAPETSDQLLLVGAGEPQLIDYDKLADAILNKITSKNYALDAGTMTLPAALNALNGNTGKCIFSGVKNKGTLYYPIEDYSFMLVVLQTSTISNTPVYIVSRYHTDICIQLLAGGRDDTKASIENEKLVVTLGFSTYVSIYSF